MGLSLYFYRKICPIIGCKIAKKALVRPGIFGNSKDKHIQKWAKLDNLVMSNYVFRDFSQIAIFSLVCWFFIENHPCFAEFSLFCIFAYYFQKLLLNLSFHPIYSLCGPFLGKLEPFFPKKVPFFGHFYMSFIRKSAISDMGKWRIFCTVTSATYEKKNVIILLPLIDFQHLLLLYF